MTNWKSLAALVLIIGLVPTSTRAQSTCESDGFHRLDFWLGEWVVSVDGRQAGTNRIVSVLDGCAIEEHWTSSDGSQGQSLFYYLTALDEWRQVWVTEYAARPGGVKEKREIEHLPDGGLRFQGAIALADGGSYLDRTTLTPLEGDRVRQVIEVSQDGGATWRATFDAIYERASAR